VTVISISSALEEPHLGKLRMCVQIRDRGVFFCLLLLFAVQYCSSAKWRSKCKKEENKEDHESGSESDFSRLESLEVAVSSQRACLSFI